LLDPLFRHETILDAIEKKKALLSECRSYNPIPDPLKGKGHMGRVIQRLEQEIADLEEEDRKLLLPAAQRRLFLNPAEDNRGRGWLISTAPEHNAEPASAQPTANQGASSAGRWLIEQSDRVETLSKKPTFYARNQSYQTIVFQGREYSLTSQAGAIVKFLHEAGGKPVARADIQSKTKCGKVFDSFRSLDGPQVWEKLIVATRGRKGFYSLRSQAFGNSQ
jgi:hypothetical protein